ncbi:hypothetical protein LTR16_012197, partial [Cryomyces antarcticus]
MLTDIEFRKFELPKQEITESHIFSQDLPQPQRRGSAQSVATTMRVNDNYQAGLEKNEQVKHADRPVAPRSKSRGHDILGEQENRSS